MSSQKKDEPVSPTGRLFLRPEMNNIIYCIIAGKNPINVDDVKATIQNSVFLKHKRFTSLLITDRHGCEQWRSTNIDVNRHIIVYNDPVGDVHDGEQAVNDYSASLSVSSPLNADKPLWELHLLMAHNCVVFRVHHALVDGTSLMSMLLSCCSSIADDANDQMQQSSGVIGKRLNKRGGVWKKVLALWFTLVYFVEYCFTLLWLKDTTTAVTGGDGVELWPRKLATAKFRIEDMKIVKNVVAHGTINDVLCGVISSGLSRYLDIRSPNALLEGIRTTCITMVNLRPQLGLLDVSDLLKNGTSTKWGNQFGMILLPLPHRRENSDPLQYLKRGKVTIDRKKQSFEAYLTYKIGSFLTNFFGSKFAGFLLNRICCNTTLSLSNMVGPKEKVTFAGNPVEYIRLNTTCTPHAITLHMMSYAGRADLQILVAKDIIPDPQVLAKCFEDALLEMKEAALACQLQTHIVACE